MADVRVTAAASTGPLEIQVGGSGTLSTQLTIDNQGPSSPIDTVQTTTGSGSAGVTVTPATSTTQQPALTVGSPRTVSTTSTVTCDAPGVKTLTVTGSLALKNAATSTPT